MEHETISRYLYLQLIQDGIRVDRVRDLVHDLKGMLAEAADATSKKLLRKVIRQIEVAMQDTPAQQLKLEIQRVKIERAEQEYVERARRTILRRS